MNPLDLIDLAIKLAAQKGEAARRSAVSRAYYGAYHVCRQLITGCGVTLPAGPESHTKLRYCLAAAIEELQDAGNVLEWLRVERNKADYDLSNPTFTRAVVLAVLKNAQTITESVARARPEEYRDAVRHYARDVLNLPVADDSP